MSRTNRIPINFWDDFYDDGFVPSGKTQETYAYVEDYDMPQAEHEIHIKRLYDALMEKFGMFFREKGIIVRIETSKIRFIHITHADLDIILDWAKETQSDWAYIYSES